MAKIDLSSLVNSFFETAARYQQQQAPQTQQKRSRQEPCTPCAANRRLQAAKAKFGAK